MSRRGGSGTWVRTCLVVFATISALCVCGPALYSKFKKDSVNFKGASSCPPCDCHCPPPLSLLKIAPGLVNLTVPGKNPTTFEVDLNFTSSVCGKHSYSDNSQQAYHMLKF